MNETVSTEEYNLDRRERREGVVFKGKEHRDYVLSLPNHGSCYTQHPIDVEAYAQSDLVNRCNIILDGIQVTEKNKDQIDLLRKNLTLLMYNEVNPLQVATECNIVLDNVQFTTEYDKEQIANLRDCFTELIYQPCGNSI